MDLLNILVGVIIIAAFITFTALTIHLHKPPTQQQLEEFYKTHYRRIYTSLEDFKQQHSDTSMWELERIYG